MSARSLALQVALRLDRDSSACAAWIDSSDRVCGKVSARPWLCSRHVKVAERRAEKQRTADEVRAQAIREKREALRPRREARLAAIDKRLRAIDPLYGDLASVDTAVQNIPIQKRLPSGTRVAELARLHAEKTQLENQLNKEIER